MFEKKLSLNTIRRAFFTTRNIGLGIGLIVVIVISYYLITQIFSAFKASDRLTEAVDKVHLLEIKNKELKQQLKDVTSLEFIEKEARDKLGLVKEGETIVVIPDERIAKILGLSDQIPQQARLPNWKGWLKLFFNN